MKISLLQQNLQTALRTIQKAVPSKPQLPILSSILIRAENNTLTLSATDLYVGMQAEVPASIEAEGTYTVPGRVFAEAISSLSGGKVVLEVVESSLNITSDTGTHFSVPVTSGEEYPDFPSRDGQSYQLSLETLKEIDSHVCFSAATDQARLILTTVLFQPAAQTQSGALEAVATDGFRLAVLAVPELATLPDPALVPAKALQEAARLADQNSIESVEMSLSESLKQVFFKVGNIQMYARLVEGEYPPYSRIMPATFGIEVIIDGGELLQQLKQASIFARDVSNVVQFTLQPDVAELQLSANGSMGTFESKQQVEVVKAELGEVDQSTENGISIAFNLKYVQDMLQTLKPEKVWFGMNESLKPAMFKVVGKENFQYVVMPFRLNG